MKIDLSCQAKKNHSVTVPRDYLEQLEQFYKESMEKHYNMRGHIRRVKTPLWTDPFGPTHEDVLFITDDSVKTETIVIVDEEGRERGVYQKRP